RVGGAAAVLVEAGDEDDLVAVHRALRRAEAPVPVLVVGQGSNLLVADAGFAGLVVCLGPGFDWNEVTGTVVRAGGGAKLPVVARSSARAGLHGLEWAVGVPGSVGGAVRMNAGGHGSDTATVLAQVRLFDLSTGTARTTGPQPLALGYRHSSLGPADVVVWAEFSLTPTDAPRAEEAVADIVRWRRQHQPGGSNAGSVFTNPDGDSAGRLVEAAGLKGERLGTAVVSTKHANFIQADPGGAADDVRRLIEHVTAVVAERTGVVLQPELRMVGFEPGPTVLATDGGDPRPSTSSGG
ncbi:MAG: UDP-N-acetylmuramate dehydrogenase, partial [Acidimicrobiales bacterium]